MFIDKNTRKEYRGNKPLVLDGITYPIQIWRDKAFLKSKGIVPLNIAQIDSRYYWQGQSTDTDGENEVTRIYEKIERLIEDKPEFNEDGTPMLDEEGNQVVTKGLKTLMIEQLTNLTPKELLLRKDEILKLSTIEDIINYDNSDIRNNDISLISIDFLNDYKDIKITEINNNNPASNPVTLTVNSQSITFNGGDASASAIAGAVDLAQKLGETNVNLWDIENFMRDFTFDDAMLISANIARVWRDAMYERNNKLLAIENATTLEELELIKW